jgi:hypothetical protein
VQLAFDGTRHQQSTRAGVSAWVDADAADSFEAVSTIGDSDPATNPHSETHFDNCYWDEGRDWVIQKRLEAVAAALQYFQSGAQADRQAFFNAFGYALHATEDFYAHSNWVETHAPGVLANFSDPGVPRPDGWYSGTYDNPADTGPDAGAAHCPPLTPPHSLLNKDGPSGPLRDEAFFDATLAVTVELQKLIAAIRSAAPSDADAVLAKLGFLATEPSQTAARSDDMQTFELAAAGKGMFTPPLFCRPGTFVSGFEQRVEEDQGSGDDTALNAVALLCSDRQGSFVERLSPWEGVWGSWSGASQCAKGQFVTRGQLKIETLQALGDDTSANAARFKCSDDAQLVADNDAAWGVWKAEVACGTGEAACGVELAYQPPQGGDDDVAMTGMRIHCCALDGADAGTVDAGDDAGSGGEAGMGGAPGSGGTAGIAGGAGNGGTSQDAGTAAQEQAPLTEDSGCGCRAARSAQATAISWLVFAALAFVARRRRTD